MRWLRIIPLLIAFFALAHAKVPGEINPEVPLIVPGTELAWEGQGLHLVLQVKKPTRLKLKLYSPGFDPKDYRSKNELGDERYDQGKGSLLAVYELRYGSHIIVRRSYGIEPHRWDTLFEGRLEPGEYDLFAKFYGNGKNAVIFKVEAPEGHTKLFVAPDSMYTYNVERGGWQTPFTLDVPEFSPTLKVGVYDADGPRELEFKAETPRGVLTPPVAGSREWFYVPTEEKGGYRFSVRMPSTAVQYTNTVGFRIFIGPIEVEIVDIKGRPVPGARYLIIGSYTRKVKLLAPPGWELVRTEIKYGRELSPGLVLFGMGAGKVRFVLRPPLGTLRVTAKLKYPGHESPYPLVVKVGDEVVRLPADTGETVLILPQDVYTLVPEEVPGARVTGPTEVEVVPGEERRADFVVEPIVELKLTADPRRIPVGEKSLVVATASTEFEDTLPGRLRIEFPSGLRPLGTTEVVGPIAKGRDLVLKVPVEGLRRGTYHPRAHLAPWNLTAVETIEVYRPLTLKLEKTADRERVYAGEEVQFTIRVINEGDEPGQVRLVDKLPPELVGEDLDVELSLAPGEEKRFLLPARVKERVVGRVVNRARLVKDGKTLLEDDAEIQVLKPVLKLTRDLDKPVVFPGEEVRVCLYVENVTRVKLAYELTDRYPNWLEPKEEPRFKAEIAPKGKNKHCYTAKVAFGPEREDPFEARLVSGDIVLTARDKIKRILMPLEKRVEPAEILLGGEAVFTVRVKNPLDRPVKVKLVDAPEKGLGFEGFTKELDLGPGEVRVLTMKAQPDRVGELRNQASVYIGDTPAARPVQAVLKVLPPLVPHRASEVELPFKVRGQGEYLLIRHRPPEGARYVPGSSRLDGRLIADPLVDDEGRLYWKIPFQPEGTVTYRLAHEKPLPPLPEAELTLVSGDQAVPLQGNLTLEDYERAKPLEVEEHREGFIKEPKPGQVFQREAIKVFVEAPYGQEVELRVNGKPVPRDLLGKAQYDKGRGVQRLEYYGVPLEVGRNVIEVRVGDETDRVEVYRAGKPVGFALIPVKAIADGRTPLRFRLELRDELGLPTGRGLVTVEARPEPIAPDAAPRESGYQVLITDGVGELKLAPMVAAGYARVKLAYGSIEETHQVYVPGRQELLLLMQGSVVARYGDGLVEFGGLGRLYAEAALGEGTLQVAVSETVTEASVVPGLMPQGTFYERFPTTGSGGDAKRPLVSEDGVAFRYTEKGFSAAYALQSLSVPGLTNLGRGTVLTAEMRGNLYAKGFVGLLPRDEVTEEIVPDGTRIYDLTYEPKPGSVKVVVDRGGAVEVLERGSDYVVDAVSRMLVLARPLWAYDDEGRPVRLLVTYAPVDAPREVLGYGFGIRLSGGPWYLSGGVANLGDGLRYGGEVGYRDRGFRFSLGYADQVWRLVLSGRKGPYSAAGSLRYDGDKVRVFGRMRALFQVTKGGKIALEHHGSLTRNRSTALYEQKIGKNLFAGLGLGYHWEKRAPAAVGRLAWRDRRTQVALTHSQAFSVRSATETQLSSQFKLDENLTARGELFYDWAGHLTGSLGLDQRLGNANLSLSYALPGAGGEGNRARFGIRAPFPLDEHWTADVHAGYMYAFSTGEGEFAAGTGIRYRREGFVATFGVDYARDGEGGKLTLRAGAAGQIDRNQVISADANYRADKNQGAFTLAYALRASTLQLLTYHRWHTEGTLEGELALGWHPNLYFQLRPAAAYRVRTNDMEATLYQVSLGANLYLTRYLGAGGGVYYLFGPGVSNKNGALAFSVEGSVRVLDPLWLNLGYTFGTFEGLTPDARPGLYLRLDYLGTYQP